MRSSVPFTDAHLSCLRSMIRMKPTPDALRLRSREAWSPWQPVHLSHLATHIHVLTYEHTAVSLYLLDERTTQSIPASNIKPISSPFLISAEKSSTRCFACSPITLITRTGCNRRDTAYRCLAACDIHHHGKRTFTPSAASRCFTFTMVTKTSFKKTQFWWVFKANWSAWWNLYSCPYPQGWW